MTETKILFKSSVEKDFKQMEHQHRKRIVKKIIKTLSNDPYAGKKLKGKYSGLFRIRIGEYRVRYTIKKDTVVIAKVGTRQSFY